MITDQLGTPDSQLGNTQLARFYNPPTFDQDVNHTLNLTQSATPGAVFNRTVEQTLTLVQDAQHPVTESVTSTLTLSHTVAVIKAHLSTVSTPLVLSHSVTYNGNYSRSIFQGLILTHAATKSIRRAIGVSQALTLTHSAVGVASKHAHNELVLSQLAEYEYVNGARNTLELTQSVDVSITVSKRLFSNLGIFHSVQVNGQFNKTVSQPLVLTQTVDYQLVKFTSNHLNLSHTVDYVLAKGTYDQLNLVQSVNVSKSVGKSAANNLINLRHSVVVHKSRAVSVRSALGLSHFVKATKVIHVSASNHLNLAQDLVRDRTIEDVQQSLNLTQEALGQKIAPRSVSSHLALTHTVTVSKTIVRHVQHTLVFNTSFQKPTGIVQHPFVDVPTAYAVKVARITILQSGFGVIVLPSAEFGDSDGNPSRINTKRAMNGTKRIYKRKTITNKLSYSFILDRVKAIELRSFVLAFNTDLITMTNWKGEVWAVLLTNNPFSFSEDAYWGSPWGNKCSITLEFEGVRLN